jgi:hypothetical protein
MLPPLNQRLVIVFRDQHSMPGWRNLAWPVSPLSDLSLTLRGAAA